MGLLGDRLDLCDHESCRSYRTAIGVTRHDRIAIGHRCLGAGSGSALDFLGLFEFSLEVRMCRFFRGIAGPSRYSPDFRPKLIPHRGYHVATLSWYYSLSVRRILRRHARG
eukprot:3014722-Prymnesium_polylepis.1